jgi:hypothetical protein
MYVALSYDDELSRGVGLSFSEIEIRVEGLQKEKGYCFVARIPPGVQRNGFLLYEDDRPLQAPTSLHDDIRQKGQGRYALDRQWLFFSSSDGSDPRQNGRIYRLRRRVSVEDS